MATEAGSGDGAHIEKMDSDSSFEGFTDSDIEETIHLFDRRNDDGFIDSEFDSSLDSENDDTHETGTQSKRLSSRVLSASVVGSPGTYR